MAQQRIVPSWDDIPSLRVPLTKGEEALAHYLDDNLPDDWEIYIQPFLNGDRPDIVILHPKAGLMIYEVKDWDLGVHHRQDGKYYVQTGNARHVIASPIDQVKRYRDNLINLYSPQIGEVVDKNRSTLIALRIGLYFHGASTQEAQGFIGDDANYCTVIGCDELRPGNIQQVVPDTWRKSSKYFHEIWVDGFYGLRAWLNPPFHDREQNDPLELNKDQIRHTLPDPQKHQRLRGPAGSGKTLVLAQRAANLAAAGKRVLVVTFNITLWHYIRDQVKRADRRFDWKLIEFTHFHGFCRDFLIENEECWPKRYGENREVFFTETVPQLVEETLQRSNAKIRIYDAILIDEGQDFHPNYYRMLCRFLSENNELAFVVDYRQNVYQRKRWLDKMNDADLAPATSNEREASRQRRWLQSMSGVEFRGPWRELKESYRLPPPLIDEANRFAECFFPQDDLVLVPPLQSRVANPLLLWKNVHTFKEIKERAVRAVKWLMDERGAHPSDIVILVPTHEEGHELVRIFTEHGFSVNHVFDDTEESGSTAFGPAKENELSVHRTMPTKQPTFHKRAFWMGNKSLKICTVHSFKGWELKHVIVITPEQWITDESLDSLMYVALTRTREAIVVFNRHKRYSDYGAAWPAL